MTTKQWVAPSLTLTFFLTSRLLFALTHSLHVALASFHRSAFFVSHANKATVDPY